MTLSKFVLPWLIFLSIVLAFCSPTLADDGVEKSLEMKKLDYELQERCGKRAAEFFKDHKAENKGKFDIL